MRALTGLKVSYYLGVKVWEVPTHTTLLLLRRASARNVSFEILNGSQVTLSTQLIMMNYSVTLFHRRSTTVYLETYPFIHISKFAEELKKGSFCLLISESVIM